MWKRISYLNKLLIVVFLSAVLFFGAYVWWTHRTSRYYYLPKGFHGWVTIKFEKEGAPPLEIKDGAYQIYIPPDGILETSSRLESGWARDEFFFTDGKTNELIPKQLENPVGGRDPFTWIHARFEDWRRYDSVLLALPDEVDTTLFEGTRIRIRKGYRDEISGETVKQIDIDPGRKLMEHFYVSDGPKTFFYISEEAPNDSLPPRRKFW